MGEVVYLNFEPPTAALPSCWDCAFCATNGATDFCTLYREVVFPTDAQDCDAFDDILGD